MRDAFVLTLGDGTDPAHGVLIGWIEHVDTGREHRFRSIDELLLFLADCIEQKRSRGADDPGRDRT